MCRESPLFPIIRELSLQKQWGGGGVDRPWFWPSPANGCLLEWCRHAWSICLQGLAEQSGKLSIQCLKLHCQILITHFIYNWFAKVEKKTGGTYEVLCSSQISKVRCSECRMRESILCSYSYCINVWTRLLSTIPVSKALQDLCLEPCGQAPAQFLPSRLETFQALFMALYFLPKWSCFGKL